MEVKIEGVICSSGKKGTEVETPVEAGIPVSDLVFDLSVEYTAETKATKQGWENGDAVFVFFQTISDYYLKMTYDGTKWNTVLASPGGSLPSTINTQGKTVTAVYRPFGSSKWLQVGPTKYVELKKGKFSLGTWCTCNYGASLPEQVGTRLSFDGAVAQHAASLKEVLQISSQPTAMGIARYVLCEIKNA